MFEKMNPAGKKLMADIIFWVIAHDTITPEEMSIEFGVANNMAWSCINALSDIDLVTKPDDASPWYVLPSEINELNHEVIDLLTNNGHPIAHIIQAFKGLPPDQKKATSNILTDSAHKWTSVARKKPEMNKPVVIRLMNPTKVYMESRTEIVYMEDIKIASWDGFTWKIEGPHTKYDFSPLSNKENINEGVEVTHWAPVTDKALKGWKTRLNPINRYEHLELKVDEKHEQNVYQAIILAAACLMKEANSYPNGDPTRDKLLKSHSIMCDLQSVIDYGIILNSEEGKTNAVDQ